ncbi:MAG: PAS domain S-box protein [Nitrospinae bacterium]|nr:PAS domain S-box protein [Nitrospinota bacterium]
MTAYHYFLEVGRIIICFLIILYIYFLSRRNKLSGGQGWYLIIIGILLIMLGNVVQTAMEHFAPHLFRGFEAMASDLELLENIPLYLGGFLALAAGLTIWMPTVKHLKESEERFRLITETINEVFWMADPAINRMIYVSPGYEKVWGRSCKSLYADPRSFIEAIHPEDVGRALADLEVQKTGQPFDHEYRIIRPGGSVAWVWDRGYPVRGDGGEVIFYVGVAKDVTARKLAADALLESEERFRLVAETTQDAVIIADEDGRIVTWNHGAEAMTGYKSSEAIGKSVAELIVPDDHRQSHENGFKRFKVNGTGPLIGKMTEIMAKKRDGSLLPVEISLSAARVRGKWTAIAMLRDISERKRAEKMLFQSEKMASIGQLAAGIAHEINNPLSFVNSNTIYMKKNIEKMFDLAQSRSADREGELKELAKLKEESIEVVNETLEGTKRIVSIVKDLRTFTHVSGEELKVEDIHAILDGTLNIVHNELKYKAEVVKEYDAVNTAIECVPSQVGQVMVNLLVNAAHAIKEKGRITVRTRDEQGCVAVEIADTGSGIPPENMVKIFDPFFTTKPPGEGTGLGLALAYNIVQKHHGTISVESEVGKGTAFTVTLPLTQPE